jgi:hypothetical protein
MDPAAGRGGLAKGVSGRKQEPAEDEGRAIAPPDAEETRSHAWEPLVEIAFVAR